MKESTLHYIARRGEPVYFSGASAYHGDKLEEPFRITCVDYPFVWIAQPGSCGNYVNAAQLSRPPAPERMPRFGSFNFFGH